MKLQEEYKKEMPRELTLIERRKKNDHHEIAVNNSGEMLI
jgi:hypothetical protein